MDLDLNPGFSAEARCLASMLYIQDSKLCEIRREK